MRAVPLALVLLLATAVLPWPAPAATVTYGSYGTHPVVGSDDLPLRLQDLPAAATPYLAREESGTAGVLSDDKWYLHFDDATPTKAKQVGDILLAAPSGTIGSLSTTGTGSYTSLWDFGLPGDGADADADAIEPFLRALETDGKPGFTDDDWLFLDADGSGTLTPGDLRISTPSVSGISTPTSRFVEATHADYLAAISTTEHDLPDTATFEAQTFDLDYFDADVDGGPDPGDTLVAVTSGRGFLGLNDVFVSASGSRAHGGRAASSTTGVVPLLQEVTEAYLVTTDPTPTVDPHLSDLYIHFGSPDGEPAGAPACEAGPETSAAPGDLGYIQFGDIILREGATGSAGAAASYMTRATSESSHGVGGEIEACAPLLDLLYYINDPSTSAVFTNDDWLYLNLPTAFGGASNTLGLSIDDLRLVQVVSGSTYAAGSTVRSGNGDLVSFGAAAVNSNSDATNPWYLLHNDADESQGVPLTALSNGKLEDSTADNLWSPATESIYISSDTTVSNGDVRLYSDPGEGLTGSTTNAFTLVVCIDDADADSALDDPGDADCGDTLESHGDLRVSGDDGTLEEDEGEFVVYSPDAWASPGHDRAVLPMSGTAAGAALSVAAGMTFGWGTSSDSYAFQWAPTGFTTPMGILRVHDVKLASSPTFVTHTSAEHVPLLTKLATADQALARYDAGSSNPASDVYYLRLTSLDPATFETGDLRMTPFGSKAAGLLLASADAAELTTTLHLDSATELEDALFYVEHPDGVTGLDPEDGVYVDLPMDLGAAAAGAFSSFDFRVSPTTVGGTTYKAGSIARVGDNDLSDLGGFAAWGTNEGYLVYFFDENKNNAFDGDDTPYLLHFDDTTAAPPGTYADLLAIRLFGSGGATGASSSSGGGSSSSSSSSTTSSSTTSSTTTSSSTTSSTTTSSTTTPSSSSDPAPSTEDLVEDMNLALQASLEVTVTDDGNLLTWDAEEDAEGYQVWRADSPFAFLALLDAGQSSFLDPDGTPQSRYLVTAFATDPSGDVVGRPDSNDLDDVPGAEDLTGVPVEGEDGGADHRGVPALGLGTLAAVGAATMLAVRRRLR